MKLLTDAAEYGLRAVSWLGHRPGQAQKVREIAEAIHAPPGYLVKVLQVLSKAGILSAQRGSQGGFTLQRDPATLTVLEVIDAIDPIERIKTCPLGLEEHRDCLCPMHRRIDDAMALIEQSFRSSTIADLMSPPPARGGVPAACSTLTVNGSSAPEPPKG